MQPNQKVGDRVLQNFAFLKRVSCTKSDCKRQKQLASANPEQLLSIVEVCSNILRGAFTLKQRQHKKLLPFAPVIRQLSRARSEKRTRHLLKQKGAGAGLLLTSLLAPVLVEAAKHLLDGK